jgi:hypothetical protein
MPEFLTEANWENDFRQMKEWVVGVGVGRASSGSIDNIRNIEFQERIRKLIHTSHRNGAIYSPIVEFCDTNEAEMLKLMKNCFLSAKVSIMNEFYDFCGATHTDYETVVAMAKRDVRMGTSHFQVPGPDGLRGFGGTCFPKDTHSLYCQMNAHGVAPQVYPAILARNDTHDRPEREWSRDIWRTTIPLPTPASKVVVVFSDGTASPGSSGSSYLMDVIRSNLAKNHVVILVVRDADIENDRCVSLSTHPNLLIKRQRGPGTALFFPRVDECYYSAHIRDTTYDTMCGVMNIIDLWNSHKEMILYVIKPSVVDVPETHTDVESGTEGFDSDCDAYTVLNANSRSSHCLDYAIIIEEHFRLKLSVIPNQKRGLVVLF